MIIRERTGVMVLAGAVVLAFATAVVFRDEVMGLREDHPWDHPWVERDLEVIAADTLRVLVLRDPLSWEERPNATTGLEYELLERFARWKKLPILAVPMDDPDSMLLALQQGRGDVIAAQFCARGKKRKWVAVTAPYQTVKPMVARLREDHLLNKDATAGSADSIMISTWSPFIDAYGRRDAPGTMVELPGTPEDLLMEVLIGTLPATLVSDAHAGHEAKRFPAIEFTEVEGPERTLAFAVRKNSKQLLDAMDEWLEDPSEKEMHDVLVGTYLDRMPKAGALRKRSMPASPDSISPYDDAFRKYGNGPSWKWQLLAAMAWKESRFDSSAVSNMGAQGILQMMPRTAERFGVDSSHAVGDHIRAAKQYVERLDTMWMRAVPDREQRLRFVLASYNAGPGHIIDAQRLAERLGLDPKLWEHNVERTIQLLAKPRYYTRPEMKNGFCRGEQVFHYVRDVTALYHQLLGTTKSAGRDRAPKGAEEKEGELRDTSLQSSVPEAQE